MAHVISEQIDWLVQRAVEMEHMVVGEVIDSITPDSDLIHEYIGLAAEGWVELRDLGDLVHVRVSQKLFDHSPIIVAAHKL